MEYIDTSDYLNDFCLHLEKNPRVLFSAKFGDGKTSFMKDLKEYTKEGTYFITLYPINYSVAPNEDIFEYIKRDILTQLAKDGLLPEIEKAELIKSVLNKSTFISLAKDIIPLFPGGKIVETICKIAGEVKYAIDSQRVDWEEYQDSFENMKGGIYESDAYTYLIQTALKNIDKRTILVVEDMDRLDPGHLFRILNVLGAHIDIDNSSNKFGFDNIVIVMDYDCTEHIFKHFYGEGANYKGYISKFYL